MSDIFLSYASEDRAHVRSLVQALERHGWSVWWDRSSILPGTAYNQMIEAALAAAKCVIVVWSRASVASEWVLDEATEGRDRCILVPVTIDDVRPPLGFRQRQVAHLQHWHGTEPDEEFAKVLRAVTAFAGSPLPQELREPAGDPPPQPLFNTTSIGMKFVLIPSGEFHMGSTDGDEDERPVHRVRISQAFYLGQTPVTQAQWVAVMGTNPSRFTGDSQRPVEQVSWEEVQEYVRRLNAQEGGGYRLPTEAEWEYAAQAGSTTAYGFGDDPAQLQAYAWYEANAGGTTQPVGQKQPNAWGLYDMHGNVWEWVQDRYGPYSAAVVTDPQGPASGSYRVARGGSWNDDAGDCRSADRYHAPPGYRIVCLGFRLLRTAP
jgi:formylglycine-generating enzyme required for sulfatase activity